MEAERKRGRPRRADATPVDYAEMEKLLVGGEEVIGRDGEKRYRYPSFREVAQRLGVAHSLVSRYAAQHNCVERRAYSGEVRRGRRRREAPPVVVPKVAPRTAPPEAPAAEVPAVPPRTFPRRAPDEPVDTNQLDQWLVHGETVPIQGASGVAIVYPSIAEITRRLGISRHDVMVYSREHDCERRRAEAEARVRAKVDQQLVELRAEAMVVTREKAIAICDEFAIQFYTALKDGRVRVDSVGDFNLITRLRSFLEGGADQRTELLGGLTLDDLRTRHAEFLADRRGDSAATVGVVDAELVDDAETPPAAPTSAPPETHHSAK
jgi:hypothetical protein